MLLSLLWSCWQRKRVFSSEMNTEGGGRKAPNSSQLCSKLRCSYSLLQLFHFKWNQRNVINAREEPLLSCTWTKWPLLNAAFWNMVTSFPTHFFFVFFCLPWGYSSGNDDACNFLAGSFWRQACDGWHEQCREEESARDKMWNQYPGFGAP